jgi:hypothetical protein
MGQGIEQDHQTNGMRGEGIQTLTQQRGELPTGKGSDNVSPP